MKKITLYVIKSASTEDGRDWDHNPDSTRYFTTEAKAKAALTTEIAGLRKYHNWVEVKKNGYEGVFKKAWIVKEIIKVEA